MNNSSAANPGLLAVLTLVAFLSLSGASANDLESRLFDAIMSEDMPAIKSLLADGADANVLDKAGDSPLILASDRINAEAVRLLVEAGANVDTKDANGQTALMRAIGVGFIVQDEYLQTVEALLDAGPDLNAQDQNGFTALIHTAMGHTSSGVLTDGERPLMVGPPGGMIVLERVYIEVVRTLLSRGADLDIRTEFGGTALMAAAVMGFTDIVDALLKAGADVNGADNHGVTALMLAANDGHIETVKFLISAGADTHALNKFGTTALHAAVANGHQEIVNLIQEARGKGAVDVVDSIASDGITDGPAVPCVHDVQPANEQDMPDLSPIYASSKEINSAIAGDLEGLKAVIEDSNGLEEGSDRSLLTLAAANGHYDLVRFLIHRGACVDIRDADGGTTLIQTSCTQLLYPETGKAMTRGFKKIVEHLLLKGADPNAASTNGMTPLSCAAVEGHTDIMGLLLDGAAELNAANSYGWTPLMFAANYGRHGTVEFLLDKGADLEKADRDGLTALMLATLEGHITVLDSLIAAGADVNVQGRLGHSPLMVVSMQGNEEIARMLIRNNADMLLKNYEDQTAMMLAKERGQLSIVTILKEAGARD